MSKENNPFYRHGFTSGNKWHPLYVKWKNAKARCYNKNNQNYDDYGGRGILMCDEWVNDAKRFIEWGLENGWEKGLQIDRIDNNKGYFPDNCRFVTAKTNCMNRRRNKNSSRFTCVYRYKNKYSYMYRTVFSGDNKTVNIGSFSNPIDAAVARDSYIISNNLCGRLNFPNPITSINIPKD